MLLQFLNGLVFDGATLDVSIGYVMLVKVMILSFWQRLKFTITHVTRHITVVAHGSINIHLCNLHFGKFFQMFDLFLDII